MQKKTKKWLALTVAASLTLTLVPTMSLAANRTAYRDSGCQQKTLWQGKANSDSCYHFLCWQDIAYEDAGVCSCSKAGIPYNGFACGDKGNIDAWFEDWYNSSGIDQEKVQPSQPEDSDKQPLEKPNDTEENLSSSAQEVVDLVNEARNEAGLEPLVVDAALTEAANIRATEIAQSFSHTRPDGSSCFTVLDEVGISYHYAAENIAMGQSSPSKVMDAWLNSSGHRANILSEQAGKIGVGIYTDAFGSIHWVQLFQD